MICFRSQKNKEYSKCQNYTNEKEYPSNITSNGADVCINNQQNLPLFGQSAMTTGCQTEPRKSSFRKQYTSEPVIGRTLAGANSESFKKGGQMSLDQLRQTHSTCMLQGNIVRIQTDISLEMPSNDIDKGTLI